MLLIRARALRAARGLDSATARYISQLFEFPFHTLGQLPGRASVAFLRRRSDAQAHDVDVFAVRHAHRHACPRFRYAYQDAAIYVWRRLVYAIQ